ncbi:MAG: imidazole glycerol phosphate synthase subunit HisH [Zetaproteobacteria bacterium]|nr:imidazole glycerol phosphate synthase subunit HisH [Zetaproteobacteria bacterium]
MVIGIIDYGMGNHASVVHSLRELGFRVRIGSEPEMLGDVDLLVLPGVGAFPTAMHHLQAHGWINFLQEKFYNDFPIIGICLGMQLLATASDEIQYTLGLNFIPGEVRRISSSHAHIGWNTIACVQDDPLFQESDGLDFYFNHAFAYVGSEAYQICVSESPSPFTSVIRRQNTVGLQFHPEKSQQAGRLLLKRLIKGLLYA